MEHAPGMIDYYNLGGEADRLRAGLGRLEAVRTQELLHRWLPAPPAVVLDIGGGSGHYALELSGEGYEVHLVDAMPLHIEQAQHASAAAPTPLASVQLGDARALPFADATADAVLLLGPLYHLVERADRVVALREAARALRANGVVIVAAISRWASTADGFARECLRDPRFAAMIERDLDTGLHTNPDRVPGWFAGAYFHRPEELMTELVAAGLEPDVPTAVEGLAGFAPDIDRWLDDPGDRDRLLALIRRTEHEPALLGASTHFLVAARRP
jgi:SAM-dependent methyltransferase